VIDAARAHDLLLGVDLAYRHTAAARALARLVQTGELGRIFAIELVFHSAHGPDAPWFYNRSSSGGGCVIDLGLHLVDLALWLTGFPEIESVSSLLRAKSADSVEDYATVQLELAGQISVRLACSWRLPAGRDAIIECALYGTGGGAALRNVDGSCDDFVAERYRGTQTERLVSPPDAWGGRAAVAWLEQLRRDRSFDPDAEDLITVADALDAIYGAPCAS
jgi:predicted dehydrogenase